MEFKFEIPFKEGDEIFTIDNCKIVSRYVDGFKVGNNISVGKDISYDIVVLANTYPQKEDASCKVELFLKNCFLTKEDLIKQL